MSKGQRHGGGHMGGMRAGEKAKDFKGTMKKLLKYMSAYKSVSYTHLDVYKRQPNSPKIPFGMSRSAWSIAVTPFLNLTVKSSI